MKNITKSLQFTYATNPSFSIIEQIFADSRVNKSNINFLKSSNLASSTPPFKTPSGVFFVRRLGSHKFSLSDYCFTLRSRSFYFACVAGVLYLNKTHSAKFSFTMLRDTSAFRSLHSLQPTQNPTRRSRHLKEAT